MAKYLVDSFGKDVEFFDLQENPLPMCDGDECYDLPEVLDFREKIKNAEGIINGNSGLQFQRKFRSEEYCRTGRKNAL